MLNKKITFFFFVTLGLFLISYYLYVRLIMHRDILLFTFSYKIIYLCCIFIFFNLLHAWIIEFIDFFYILWFEKKEPSNIAKSFINKLNKLIEYLLIPFNAVYILLKKWSYFNTLLFKISAINYKFSPYYQLPYILFNLFPRIIVSIALYIDIQFGYLYYFYYALPGLLIVLIYKLFIKKSTEIFIERLDVLANTQFKFLWLFEDSFEKLLQQIDINKDPNQVYFSYYTHIPQEKQSYNFFNNCRLLYMIAIFQSSFSYLPYEDEVLYNLSRVLHFVLAMQWWYILFTILLNK